MYLYCKSTHVDTILQGYNSRGPPVQKVRVGRAILLGGDDPLLSGLNLFNINFFKIFLKINIKFAHKLKFF